MRKPPSAVADAPMARVPTSQPRSVGNPLMASPPSASSRHRSSGEDTPPGNRQLRPTMAMGSSATGRAVVRGVPVSAIEPSISSSRNRDSPSGVGWS